MKDGWSDISDEGLAKRSKEGEMGAFEELVRRHEVAVQRWILWIDRRPDRVEDIAQETFIKAWRGISGFRGDSSWRTWILKIAMRACLDEKRRTKQKEKRELSLMPDFILMAEASNNDRVVMGREDIMAVRDCLDSLSPIHRALLVMRHMEGYNASEIANILNRPSGTVRRLLCEARQAMKESFESSGARKNKAQRKP